MHSQLTLTTFALALALLIGFAACAKYPVVVKTGGQAPTAATTAPAR